MGNINPVDDFGSSSRRCTRRKKVDGRSAVLLRRKSDTRRNILSQKEERNGTKGKESQRERYSLFSRYVFTLVVPATSAAMSAIMLKCAPLLSAFATTASSPDTNPTDALCQELPRLSSATTARVWDTFRPIAQLFD